MDCSTKIGNLSADVLVWICLLVVSCSRRTQHIKRTQGPCKPIQKHVEDREVVVFYKMDTSLNKQDLKSINTNIYSDNISRSILVLWWPRN